MHYTPMVKQYLQIKQNYQDTILFFRLGDFYEMFFQDAELASRELEITLTARDGGKGKKIPMCGVPHHSANTYIARLIAKNYKIAICEQVELPGESKGIIKREVIKVITPGTVMDDQLLEDKSHNYLVAIVEHNNHYGFAYTDISTGHFLVTQFYGERAKEFLFDELTRLQPREILIHADNVIENIEKNKISGKFMVSPLAQESCTIPSGKKMLERHYGSQWKQSGLEHYPAGICAAGGLLSYLYKIQKQQLSQIGMVQVYSPGEFMILDAATRRNLELTMPLVGGNKKATLISILDFTCTAMGGRMLKNWLVQPLMNIDEIIQRQEAVHIIKSNVFLRNSLQKILHSIFDLERLGGKIASGSANARDMISVRQSLKNIPQLVGILDNTEATLLNMTSSQIDCLDDICELLERSIVEEPPVSIREGGIIRAGYHDEIDKLRASTGNGKRWLLELESKEKEKTGIKSLKIKFNRVFGYYIEVTKANLDQVPPDYIRKQTLVNAERFITPQLKEYEKLILGAEDRLVQLEYQLFTQIRDKITGEVKRLQKTAECVARIDVLFSLAKAAVRYNYVCPRLSEAKELVIKKGRHPVVEFMQDAGEFIPNDTCIGRENFISLITGPNMAGKSTYMRQVALIVLMAQIGSFIPAEKALIGVTDRIFTRVGAADDLTGGKSTFMVEMSECCTIVKYATAKSLVIMDEVGRGTSTYDGISLARAIVEHMHKHIQARTLFSTHYHELTDLEYLPGVKNYTIAIQEQGEKIVFLRKLQPGKADKSYGIHVARLAGLPEEILKRAQEALSTLEKQQEKQQNIDDCEDGYNQDHNKNIDSMNSDLSKQELLSINREFNFYAINAILQELKEINIIQITPLEALNTIAHWHDLLAKIKKPAIDNKADGNDLL